MNREFRIDDENVIVYRLTPWDTKSFGFTTSELLSVTYSDKANLDKLMAAFHAFNKQEGVRFCYGRINSRDQFLKDYLQHNGFYYAETSLSILKNNILSFVPDERVPKLTLEKATPEDYEAIKTISRDDFDHSRFHEDINIDKSIARNRFYNWAEDLIRQEREVYVVRLKGEIIGFNIQYVEGDTAHIILTGCKKSKSVLSVALWQAVIMDLKDRNIRNFATLISATNTGVFNLYCYFGFKVMNTLVGMHKFYD